MNLMMRMLLVLPGAFTLCFCPVELADWHSQRSFYDRRLCEDSQSAKECDQANWEVNDMITSAGRNADMFLDGMMSLGEITPKLASFVRTKLSRAFEEEKPEGECANGLGTNTKVDGTSSWCFSPELLQECARVQREIGPYTKRIPLLLRQALMEDTKSAEYGVFAANNTEVLVPAVEDFIDSVANRAAIATARIKCASYLATLEVLNSAATAFLGYAAAAVSVAVTLLSVL